MLPLEVPGSRKEQASLHQDNRLSSSSRSPSSSWDCIMDVYHLFIRSHGISVFGVEWNKASLESFGPENPARIFLRTRPKR
jgi:hypothetical protein